MHQNLTDQIKTQSRTFVIGHANLDRDSRVPRRCIATAIPLAPLPKSWHGGAEAVSLMGGCGATRTVNKLV